MDGAISRSRSSIIVFSRNYVYSPRCLDQLLKMFAYSSETKRLVIVPVFYQVSKDQIRMQAERLAALLPGMYKKQFEREKVEGSNKRSCATASSSSSSSLLRHLKQIVEAIEEKADRSPRKSPPV
ncbi:hypothetical protein RJ639_019409 [Escallonia herrerae]|uniref:ADP-ribosyl cyclase/cyclic ADP-ribose hydrolase n=1 Tax=Escallonia herrerae TaxID=1293975 RepID=A0AA88VCR8_9ASTE|nr:hypothetical protein RJ639_019409 [Escallonia herrerae]